ncbi:DUF6531 domain-containing protein [Streptomyces sp. NBC_01537]|uniref:DUF6531 domain-containing protein n=1 Tax=Streptomyces sp. NBC_01537 TaxID=2903896 RepID=UPI00386AF527
MGRPADWHVLDLDKDPTPGDPVQVENLARRIHGFADDVGTALRSIRGLSGDSAVQTWTGLSGDEYRRQFDDLPGELDKLERSYRLCGDALATYWPKLQQAQGDADRALEQGRQARADLNTAQSHLNSANDWVDRANAQSQQYQQSGSRPEVPPPTPDQVRAATRNANEAQASQRSAQSAVGSAQAMLDAAKQLAEEARGLRDNAAHTAKRAIDDASDAGIQNKAWYEKAVDWVADHWDEIVAVCKVVVAVLGVIVMIIGGPLAWLVLAAALVVLADTLMKYADGKASLWDVLFAALDCIPGFKGLTTAGGLLKMAKGGLPAIKGGLGAMSKALRGLGNGLRREADDLGRAARKFNERPKCNDPVDPVTGEVIMQQADVVLPGAMPLVLQRTHISSYRTGRWFGPSWASTLDQRLEIDAEGVCYAGADGSTLIYPVPEPDRDVYPIEGERWPLSWDDTPGGDIRITSRATGCTLHFFPLGGGRLPETEIMTLPLRAISDRNGNRVEFDYDGNGAPTEIRHSGGYRISVETHDGRVTGLYLRDDPEQLLLVRYGYDKGGRLTEITNSSGLPLHLSYDPVGQLTGWKDRNGTNYQYLYDEDGRCVRVTGSDDFLSGTLEYDAEHRITVAVNSLGHATTFAYNEAHQVVRVTDPLGHTTITERDRYNRLLSETDPLGRTTRYRYDDEHEFPVNVTRPDGTVASVEYNDLLLPVTSIEPDGSRWQWTYDERGNRTSSTDALGNTTTFTYDQRGNMTSVVDAQDVAQLRLGCDEAGLPMASTDAYGATRRYTRDVFGRITKITGPLGETTELAWTTEGLLTRRVLPNGATDLWTYDGEGNLLEHRSPTGLTTRYETTRFDLLSARTSPDGTRCEYSYDTEQHLLAVTNSQGLTWKYEYDAAGRLISETDFNGRTVSYSYDPAGQLTERTNGAGQTIHFIRDLLGDIIERRWGEGSTSHVASYEYDALSRLVRAVNDDADLVREYDTVGRLVSETCNGRTVLSRYDGIGRRVERVAPSGVRSTWEYDHANRVIALHSGNRSLDFVYDSAGREIERRLGDAAILSQGWDSGSRLEAQSIINAGPTTRLLQQRNYTYDDNGFLAAIDELTTGSRRFTTDAAGRVCAVTGTGWAESYTYDALGNLSRAVLPPLADSGDDGEHTYSGTLVRRAGRTSYRHDRQGRVVRRSRKLLSGGSKSWQYTWDAEDRLTDVITPDGSRWHYLYDPLGRRTAKQRLAEDGTTVLEQTDFVWDRAQLAEQARSDLGSGNLYTTTWDWTPGGPAPLTQTDRSRSPSPSGFPLHDADQNDIDERFYAIVTDLVGSPAELIDESGGVAWLRRTTLWGTPLDAPPEDVDCPLRFPGQYHDAETGLHYNFRRYYEPETARYLSPDPLGLEPAPNHHAYVGNPLMWTDPLGLAPCFTQVDYNSTELGNLAFLRRFQNGQQILGAKYNVAVAHVPGWNHPVTGDFIYGINREGGLHAEMDILRQIDAHPNLSVEDIKSLYSERQPCAELKGGEPCRPVLSDRLANTDAKIEYSFPYHSKEQDIGMAYQSLLGEISRHAQNNGYSHLTW